MFSCIRRLNLPFNQSYLSLKCVSLGTQSYPKAVTCELLPMQCETLRPADRKPVEDDVFREDSVVKHELEPYDALSRAQLLQFAGESFRVQPLCSLVTCLPDSKPSGPNTVFSILDELRDLNNLPTNSSDIVRHQVLVIPEIVRNSQNADQFLVQCNRLFAEPINITQVNCSSGQSSSTVDNKSSGKASEEQLLRVEEALVQCLPRFFTSAHNLSIYHKNVIFHNNISGFTTRGLGAYSRHLLMVRFLAILKYNKVQMHILKVTHHPEDGTVRVRWRVSGIKLFIFAVKFANFMPSKKAPEWTDGFSIFHVGPDGLVFKHVCDKMMPDDNVEKVPTGPLGVKFAAALGLLSNGNCF